MINAITFDKIESVPTSRISTGFVLLDIMLGRTGNTLDPDVSYGAVRGSQIMLAGSSGCGKSRLAIDIAANVNYDGFKVLYFQLEASLGDFRVWAKNKIKNTDTFFVSEERDYKKQAEIIRLIKPDLVVIDSVNKYEVHHSKVGEVVDTLQGAARDTNCVNLMIGQLDMKGGGTKMEVRGSQNWVFLPDVILHAYKNKLSFKEHKEAMLDEMKRETLRLASRGVIDAKLNSAQKMAMDIAIKDTYEEKNKKTSSQFVVAIPEKNRYGSVGKKVIFQHDAKGVFEL